mmetsp:Transcript_1649/g.2609  ORF Transcript_1649/g.2609 Transcript_1649/m.2609 type:complete len:143 (-) Transcript_1649:45-473(-)|eukprot:CAMPEP_0185020016 /NCGR_PEP_ID=MMETSP1103-20130426/2609_1 /TAXON_ID=36769 /ORGANISM="Paraphysomonas bandaiensis, Strain Caron Lab Isolate" /LENGTH=142 /DNA_ID=CAMNT_0027550651 /DNA_START=47 /DNA_END=475 /DNA_ORIENTATION=-
MSSLSKVPRAIRMIAKFGGDAFKREVVNGKYIAPKVSRRAAAGLRKRALIAGTFGSFDPVKGGWDPAWDAPPKVVSYRPHRGHIRDRNRPERAHAITKAMEGMPDKEAKYYQDMQERRPVKNLRFRMKRISLFAKQKAQMRK